MCDKIYNEMNEVAVKKCTVELREPMNELRAHLDSMRNWAKSVKHLNVPCEDEILLRFLRYSKFNHLKAQKRIDKYCTFRASPKGHPQWFDFGRLNRELFDMVLDTNIFVPLGVADDGQLVIMSQISQWDPEVIPLDSMMQVIMACIDLISMNSNSQIYGISVIIDLDRANSKVKKMYDQSSMIRNWGKLFEDVYPIRVKNVIFYRDPLVFELVNSFRSLGDKQKLRHRTVRVKNNLEKETDRIPGLERLLPIDYNGSNVLLDVLSENWKNQVQESYMKLANLFTNISVDESLRPTKRKITNNKKEVDENVVEHLPSEGSYTNLNKF